MTTDYLEKALSLVERIRMERHLAGRPAHAAYLERTRVLISVARRMNAGKASTELVDEIVALYCRLRVRPSGSPRTPW